MFPLLYHTHHSLHSEDLDFWTELAGQQGSPVLELGCGTGRVLQRLAETGMQMYGLDLDYNMLAYLHKRLGMSIQPELKVFQADMARFCLAKAFPLIILPCNTYSVLPQATRQETLQRVLEHLAPDGLFAASLPNPFAIEDLPEEGEAEVEDRFSLQESGEAVQVSSGWRRTSQFFEVDWYYDLFKADGKLERISAHVHHNRTPTRVYLEELQQAGFGQVDLYGDFDFSDYEPESPYLIFTAKR